MAIIIDGRNSSEYTDLLHSCHVFRRHWQGAVMSDGDGPVSLTSRDKAAILEAEIPLPDFQDGFDDKDVAHFVILKQDDIVAYCRLVPTTGSHPAAAIFPSVFGVQSYPSGPGIYELSPLILGDSGTLCHSDSDACQELVSTLMEHCRERQIWGLILAVETSWLGWMLGCGYEIFPLGLPCAVQERVMVPLRMRVV